jgi:hypothetical protein
MINSSMKSLPNAMDCLLPGTHASTVIHVFMLAVNDLNNNLVTLRMSLPAQKQW